MNLDALLRQIDALPRHEVPAVLAHVLGRMMSFSSPPPAEPTAPPAETWISVKAAAEMLGRDEKWVYRRLPTRPWRGMVSRIGRSVSVSRDRLQRYMEQHRGD